MSQIPNPCACPVCLYDDEAPKDTPGKDCCGRPLWLDLANLKKDEEPAVYEATLTQEGAPLPGPATGPYIIKDSGKREAVGSGGMVRDTEEGKTDYTLALDGPMFDRWAVHLTKGAVKYAARNWMKCVHPEATREELEKAAERFRRSAARHFRQYMRGDRDEDHAAAVFFNINGLEYVEDALATMEPVQLKVV